MCPYKRVSDRKYKPLWITPEIYQQIRKRKRLFRLYRQTGCYDILRHVYILRNKVNSLVDKAKGEFIRRKLNQNSRNPKRFWQSINSLIKDKIEIDIGNIMFKDPDTGLDVDKISQPNFLNNFFANLSERTRGPDADIDPNDLLVNNDVVLPGFDFEPVTIDCFCKYVNEIDLTMSSCIEGINMKMCKILLEIFMEKWAKLFNNSLF